MVDLDAELKCKVCGTHWIPGEYKRKEVREGYCPDCGYPGVPCKKSECRFQKTTRR
jgi:RNase P subunit RPR2